MIKDTFFSHILVENYSERIARYWLDNSALSHIIMKKAGPLHDYVTNLQNVWPHRIFFFSNKAKDSLDPDNVNPLEVFLTPSLGVKVGVAIACYLTLAEILQFLPDPSDLGYSVNQLIDLTRLVQYFESMRYIECSQTNAIYNTGDYKHIYVIRFPGNMILFDSAGQSLAGLDYLQQKFYYFGRQSNEYSDFVSFLRGSLYRLIQLVFPKLRMVFGSKIVRNLDQVSAGQVHVDFNYKIPTSYRFNKKNLMLFKQACMVKLGLDPKDRIQWNNFDFSVIRILNPYYARWGLATFLTKNNVSLESLKESSEIRKKMKKRRFSLSEDSTINMLKDSLSILNQLLQFREKRKHSQRRWGLSRKNYKRWKFPVFSELLGLDLNSSESLDLDTSGSSYSSYDALEPFKEKPKPKVRYTDPNRIGRHGRPVGFKLKIIEEVEDDDFGEEEESSSQEEEEGEEEEKRPQRKIKHRIKGFFVRRSRKKAKRILRSYSKRYQKKLLRFSKKWYYKHFSDQIKWLYKINAIELQNLNSLNLWNISLPKNGIDQINLLRADLARSLFTDKITLPIVESNSISKLQQSNSRWLANGIFIPQASNVKTLRALADRALVTKLLGHHSTVIRMLPGNLRFIMLMQDFFHNYSFNTKNIDLQLLARIFLDEIILGDVLMKDMFYTPNFSDSFSILRELIRTRTDEMYGQLVLLPSILNGTENWYYLLDQFLLNQYWNTYPGRSSRFLLDYWGTILALNLQDVNALQYNYLYHQEKFFIADRLRRERLGQTIWNAKIFIKHIQRHKKRLKYLQYLNFILNYQNKKDIIKNNEISLKRINKIIQTDFESLKREKINSSSTENANIFSSIINKISLTKWINSIKLIKFFDLKKKKIFMRYRPRRLRNKKSSITKYLKILLKRYYKKVTHNTLKKKKQYSIAPWNLQMYPKDRFFTVGGKMVTPKWIHKKFNPAEWKIHGLKNPRELTVKEKKKRLLEKKIPRKILNQRKYVKGKKNIKDLRTKLYRFFLKYLSFQQFFYKKINIKNLEGLEDIKHNVQYIPRKPGFIGRISMYLTNQPFSKQINILQRKIKKVLNRVKRKFKKLGYVFQSQSKYFSLEHKKRFVHRKKFYKRSSRHRRVANWFRRLKSVRFVKFKRWRWFARPFFYHYQLFRRMMLKWRFQILTPFRFKKRKDWRHSMHFSTRVINYFRPLSRRRYKRDKIMNTNILHQMIKNNYVSKRRKAGTFDGTKRWMNIPHWSVKKYFNRVIARPPLYGVMSEWSKLYKTRKTYLPISYFFLSQLDNRSKWLNSYKKKIYKIGGGNLRKFYQERILKLAKDGVFQILPNFKFKRGEIKKMRWQKKQLPRNLYSRYKYLNFYLMDLLERQKELSSHGKWTKYVNWVKLFNKRAEDLLILQFMKHFDLELSIAEIQKEVQSEIEQNPEEMIKQRFYPRIEYLRLINNPWLKINHTQFVDDLLTKSVFLNALDIATDTYWQDLQTYQDWESSALVREDEDAYWEAVWASSEKQETSSFFEKKSPEVFEFEENVGTLSKDWQKLYEEESWSDDENVKKVSSQHMFMDNIENTWGIDLETMYSLYGDEIDQLKTQLKQHFQTLKSDIDSKVTIVNEEDQDSETRKAEALWEEKLNNEFLTLVEEENEIESNDEENAFLSQQNWDEYDFQTESLDEELNDSDRFILDEINKEEEQFEQRWINAINYIKQLKYENFNTKPFEKVLMEQLLSSETEFDRSSENFSNKFLLKQILNEFKSLETEKDEVLISNDLFPIKINLDDPLVLFHNMEITNEDESDATIVNSLQLEEKNRLAWRNAALIRLFPYSKNNFSRLKELFPNARLKNLTEYRLLLFAHFPQVFLENFKQSIRNRSKQFKIMKMSKMIQTMSIYFEIIKKFPNLSVEVKSKLRSELNLNIKLKPKPKPEEKKKEPELINPLQRAKERKEQEKRKEEEKKLRLMKKKENVKPRWKWARNYKRNVSQLTTILSTLREVEPDLRQNKEFLLKVIRCFQPKFLNFRETDDVELIFYSLFSKIEKELNSLLTLKRILSERSFSGHVFKPFTIGRNPVTRFGTYNNQIFKGLADVDDYISLKLMKKFLTRNIKNIKPLKIEKNYFMDINENRLNLSSYLKGLKLSYLKDLERLNYFKVKTNYPIFYDINQNKNFVNINDYLQDLNIEENNFFNESFFSSIDDENINSLLLEGENNSSSSFDNDQDIEIENLLHEFLIEQESSSEDTMELENLFKDFENKFLNFSETEVTYQTDESSDIFSGSYDSENDFKFDEIFENIKEINFFSEDEEDFGLPDLIEESDNPESSFDSEKDLLKYYFSDGINEQELEVLDELNEQESEVLDELSERESEALDELSEQELAVLDELNLGDWVLEYPNRLQLNKLLIPAVFKPMLVDGFLVTKIFSFNSLLNKNMWLLNRFITGNGLEDKLWINFPLVTEKIDPTDFHNNYWGHIKFLGGNNPLTNKIYSLTHLKNPLVKVHWLENDENYNSFEFIPLINEEENDLNPFNYHYVILQSVKKLLNYPMDLQDILFSSMMLSSEDLIFLGSLSSSFFSIKPNENVENIFQILGYDLPIKDQLQFGHNLAMLYEAEKSNTYLLKLMSHLYTVQESKESYISPENNPCWPCEFNHENNLVNILIRAGFLRIKFNNLISEENKEHYRSFFSKDYLPIINSILYKYLDVLKINNLDDYIGYKTEMYEGLHMYVSDQFSSFFSNHLSYIVEEDINKYKRLVSDFNDITTDYYFRVCNRIFYQKLLRQFYQKIQPTRTGDLLVHKYVDNLFRQTNLGIQHLIPHLENNLDQFWFPQYLKDDYRDYSQELKYYLKMVEAIIDLDYHSNTFIRLLRNNVFNSETDIYPPINIFTLKTLAISENDFWHAYFEPEEEVDKLLRHDTDRLVYDYFFNIGQVMQHTRTLLGLYRPSYVDIIFKFVASNPVTTLSPIMDRGYTLNRMGQILQVNSPFLHKFKRTEGLRFSWLIGSIKEAFYKHSDKEQLLGLIKKKCQQYMTNRTQEFNSLAHLLETEELTLEHLKDVKQSLDSYFNNHFIFFLSDFLQDYQTEEIDIQVILNMILDILKIKK